MPVGAITQSGSTLWDVHTVALRLGVVQSVRDLTKYVPGTNTDRAVYGAASVSASSPLSSLTRSRCPWLRWRAMAPTNINTSRRAIERVNWSRTSKRQTASYARHSEGSGLSCP